MKSAIGIEKITKKEASKPSQDIHNLVGVVWKFWLAETFLLGRGRHRDTHLSICDVFGCLSGNVFQLFQAFFGETVEQFLGSIHNDCG